MRQIKKECYSEKIPMLTAILNTNENGEEKLTVEVITPAAVDYEPVKPQNGRLFYDLNNLASGRFHTEPNAGIAEGQDDFDDYDRFGDLENDE